jgi:pimeloyl-ACP methyl ester carboxylesterase
MRSSELAPPPLGRHLDVGGRRLWFHRSGTGGPAAVFLPGAGAMGLDYLLAHDRVAQITTSVLYDRAGTGWSEDADLPRPLDDVVDELRALLRGADLTPPHLLVGHSLGGAYAQRFAQRFPAEVAALLQLEPLHPDHDRYLPEHLRLAAHDAADALEPEVTDDLLALARAQLGSGMFDAFPEPLRRALIDKHVGPGRLLTGMREGANAASLLDALRAGGPLPDVPLIVLSGGAVGAQQTAFRSEQDVRLQIAGSRRLFDAVAAAVPRGEHRVLPDASHVTLALARPDAVADAVRELVARAGATRA